MLAPPSSQLVWWHCANVRALSSISCVNIKAHTGLTASECVIGPSSAALLYDAVGAVSRHGTYVKHAES